MSFFRKAMFHLGLGPDDEYGDDDGQDELPRPARSSAAAAQRYQPPAPAPAADPYDASAVSVRTLAPNPAPAPEVPTVTARPRQSTVRPIAAPVTAKPSVISPTSFNHAQEVADKFKENQPVIVNLQGADKDLSRRLIDFASGLCYGLGGSMEKVADKVYLLSPSNVEVSAEERRRVLERGL